MKKVLLITGISLLSVTTIAQTRIESDTTQTDMTTRIGFEVNRDLYRGLSLSWEEEARFKNLSTEFDRLYSTLNLGYRVNDYFKVGAGYTLALIWLTARRKPITKNI